jgi:hypothetical protein
VRLTRKIVEERVCEVDAKAQTRLSTTKNANCPHRKKKRNVNPGTGGHSSLIQLVGRLGDELDLFLAPTKEGNPSPPT